MVAGGVLFFDVQWSMVVASPDSRRSSEVESGGGEIPRLAVGVLVKRCRLTADKIPYQLTDQYFGQGTYLVCKPLPSFTLLVRNSMIKVSEQTSLLLVFLHSLSFTVSAEEGTASYYADSLHGNPTASGEPYDKNDMTAAHRAYQFGTKVTVTNLSNNKSVVVRINDRGPHTKDRIIDVSGAAAEKLGLLDSGIAEVLVEEVE